MDIREDPNEMVLCPYNPAHRISRKRINTHLTKCRRSNPEAKLVECEFNVNHRVPEPELQYHHENCASKKELESKVYQEDGQDLGKFPIYNPTETSEEAWDNDNHPSYNPNEYIEKREVLRGFDVESSSKKKSFQQNERKRLAQLNSSARPNKSLPQSERRANISEPGPSSSDTGRSRYDAGLSRYDPGPSTSASGPSRYDPGPPTSAAGPSTANGVSPTSERQVPSQRDQVQVVNEDAPDSVAELLKRIKSGKKTSFIPKQTF